MKILLLTCNLLLTVTLFAWQPVGTYKSGLDSLVFIDGKATFRITSFTGLSTAKVGEGTFEQIEISSDKNNGLFRAKILLSDAGRFSERQLHRKSGRNAEISATEYPGRGMHEFR